MGGNHEFLLNTLIFISKWSIWKARNKVKYDKIHINQNVLCNIWKQTLKSELKWLPPILNPNIIFFSFKLTVPTFKVFIKIVMFDMNRLDIMHLKNKCWRSS
jgi:hypothetical protein